jgi:hypothetical protein
MEENLNTKIKQYEVTLNNVNCLSDHDAQYLILKNVCIKSNITPMKYRTRLINDDTVKIFQHSLKHEAWELVYLNKDINGMFNEFLNLFINIFETSFPVKYKNLNTSEMDWITKGIKVSFETSFPVKYKNLNTGEMDWITTSIKVSSRHKSSLSVADWPGCQLARWQVGPLKH